MINISELATELNTDPAALGYATHLASGEDSAIVSLLNDNAGAGSGTVDRIFVDAKTFQSAVVGSEYLALTTPQQNLWLALINASQGNINIKNTNIRNQVLAVWGAGTTTRVNLGNLQTKNGSRAEVLWGDGTIVSFDDVAAARRI